VARVREEDRSVSMFMPRTASDPGHRLRLVSAAEATDDGRLVRALVEGEAWAATVTWNRYAPMVHRLFSRALGRISECDDLIQDVFLSVFTAIRSLRDPAARRSFVYSCAVRRLRSHLRYRRLRSIVPLFGPDAMPESPTVGADIDGRQVLRRFYSVLDKLAFEDRTAYTLRHLEGLRITEIGAATGVSNATVKRRIARAVEAVAAHAERDPLLAEYLVADGGPDGE
jgi:RNA polymerase sigma-70 factor (ECF subfamily)